MSLSLRCFTSTVAAVSDELGSSTHSRPKCFSLLLVVSYSPQVSEAVAVLLQVQSLLLERPWGGWDLNPRPKDYESFALTS